MLGLRIYVVCYNAYTGAGVPQDLAVIGCGNLHFDDSIRVPLSSIDQRSGEIGRRAAKLILELVKEDATLERYPLLQRMLQSKAINTESQEIMRSG